MNEAKKVELKKALENANLDVAELDDAALEGIAAGMSDKCEAGCYTSCQPGCSPGHMSSTA